MPEIFMLKVMLTDLSEFVLERDGTNVVVNNACVAQSGSWRSKYDGETTTNASDLDIDHMVPLKNAWIVSDCLTSTKYSRLTCMKVGCCQLDNSQAPELRQRRVKPSAVGCHGWCQPFQGRQEP